ncbi:MAG: putative alpha/beta hydrolase family esterase [Sulfurimonas sp.]|jgi:predicted alpha/beta hydrolase family esterase|uniref:RBBP9/YdeN family alpha/beta hydrolase n=1 Tax=Sulfurimonas sp. TaxID=2022749 RepID=UPI0039E27292
MNKKILLLHGWGGSDFPHWQSWLAGELAKEYGTVSFLKLSNFDFPDLAIWKQELKNEIENFNPDIVICHSLANTLWFHTINEIGEVKKLYLVAPPSFTCLIEEIDEFFPLKLPTNTNAQETLLICSTDDPYMNIDEAKTLQKSLNVEMKILQNAGHINADSGYGEWPWILEEIKKDLKN